MPDMQAAKSQSMKDLGCESLFYVLLCFYVAHAAKEN